MRVLFCALCFAVLTLTLAPTDAEASHRRCRPVYTSYAYTYPVPYYYAPPVYYAPYRPYGYYPGYYSYPGYYRQYPYSYGWYGGRGHVGVYGRWGGINVGW